MARAIQQELFDTYVGATPAGSLAMFAAVPSSYPERELVLETLQKVCDRVSRRWGRELSLTSGDDSGSNDPAHVSAWQRRTIACDVDVLLAIHGDSWGCSREYTLAGEFKVPRLQAFPELAMRSAARGPDGCGVAATGGFSSRGEFDKLVDEWLEAFAPDIDARNRRRTNQPAFSESIRQPTLRAWNQRDEPTKRKLARMMGATVAQLDSLLMSDWRYAEEHVESVLKLASELGVSPLEAAATEDGDTTGGELDGAELAGFDHARVLLHLSDEDSALLLAAGRTRKREQHDFHLAGIETRDSLRSSNGWLKTWGCLCEERGT